jgi:hypothetical protein
MKVHSSAASAFRAAMGFTLLAAVLVLSVGPRDAAAEGGRRSGRGDRGYSARSDRGHFSGGARGYRPGAGREYRGGRSGRRPVSGGYDSRERGQSGFGSGGYSYREQSRANPGRGGRVYADRDPRPYGGGYYGGSPSRGGRHYAGSYDYRYSDPGTCVRFGIGYGAPEYSPPVYVYDAPRQVVLVEPAPEAVDRAEPPAVEHTAPAPEDNETNEPRAIAPESGAQVDVENLPPAGTYYFDRFCGRQFANLDEYTDHIDQQDHAKTIEIVEQATGERVRTLEFVGGYWSVQE